ncbi:MAG: Ig-like domain-containing protein [Verrucomicrobiota bacterium JB022]|nr:Ig-like domain-containing protein [Verrucomicrobiota bacterium JB022]
MIIPRIPSSRGRLCLACLSTLATLPAALSALPAFPGAEGFGAQATGGRGGSVYTVTNLNDSGPGSFRDAVSAPDRTVVFAVGGIIEISSRIPVSRNITIAGQTAPGEGITIYGNGVSFSNASNTICRFIRFRQGINGDSGTDAVGIASGSDMIFDHVSASWGRDETFSVTGSAENVTLQDCIVGQGLLTHSAGGLMEPAGPVSVFRSLYADNWMRNPKVKGTHEFTNNVVYNWGSGGAYICGGESGRESFTNIINNLFIAGFDTGGTPAFIRGNLNFHTYAAGNFQDATPDGALDALPAAPSDFTEVVSEATPYEYPGVARLLTAHESLEHIAQHAGASLHRDSVDARMVEETLSFGTLGQQIFDEDDVGGVGTVAGGLAPVDTDGDGMPDWWEMAAGLDLTTPDHNEDPDGDGYTNLEDYLNAIAYAGVPGAWITAIADDTGSFADDGTTSDNTLMLSGTAIPNSQVTLRRLGVGVIGTSVANAAGEWTFDYTGTALEDNYYVFFASATIEGQESTLSSGFVVKVDTTPAEAPVISSLVVSPETVFQGSAEPGATVEVRAVGGSVVATATADGRGLWSAPYTGAALSAGVHEFLASATDLAGNAGADSAAFAVDTSLAAPVFTLIESDTGISDSDQLTSDNTLILRGTAPAGSTVEIRLEGEPGLVGSVPADSSGAWMLDLTSRELAEGTYAYRATATTGGSASPASPPFTVTVDRTGPTIPSLVRYQPASSATSASTLVYRVTWSEAVTGFDVDDLALSLEGSGMTGTIASVTPISDSVYDVTVTGAGGDGRIRLDRAENSTVWDFAGNQASSRSYTGGQSYAMRLVGSGVWTQSLEDGEWGDPANWQGGTVPGGVGTTADFGSLELAEDVTVVLDSPRTVGRLLFNDADVDTVASWTLASENEETDVLTLQSLGTPTIEAGYRGAEGDSAATVAAASLQAPAQIAVPLAGNQGLTKTGGGTAWFYQPINIEGDLTMPTSSGYFRLGEGSSYAPENVTIGTSAQLQVDGGELEVPSTITLDNGGQSGVQVYAGRADINLITTKGNRDGVVKVAGGVANIGEIRLQRTSNSETEANTFSRAGFFVQGGVANVGTLTIPSGNSWSALSVEGGELNITGPAILANQVTSGRGAVARVTGGRFNVGHAEGLILSKRNGSNANNVVKINFSGGVSTFPALVLGYDETVDAGNVEVRLDGGAVYLGSGGLAKNGTSGMTTLVELSSGMLGATADWESAVDLDFPPAGSVRLTAGDEEGAPHMITLHGMLSGEGAIVKDGAGILQLTSVSPYTGTISVDAGVLQVTGALSAGNVVVNSGGKIAGDGNIGGTLTLKAASTLLVPSGEGSPLSVSHLTGDAGPHFIEFASREGMSRGQAYPVVQAATTDLQAGDFSLAPSNQLRGELVSNESGLQLQVTGVGPGAAFQHWAYQQGLSEGEDGTHDNPAGDGIPNLLKFALGLDPHQAGEVDLQLMTVTEGEATFPAVRFVRRSDLGDVVASVRVSTAPGFQEVLDAVEIAATDNGDGTETVLVRSTQPLSVEATQFLDLLVTIPAE